MNAVRCGWVSASLLIVHACACAPDFGGTTEQLRMSSTATGDDYLIEVHLPSGYDDAYATRYPVALVLDGTSASRPTAEFAEESDIPPLIAVGIGYPEGFAPERRFLDYTPTSDPSAASGGAAQFLSFLQDDVLPEIELRYRVDDQPRILMGHSLGGLFAVHVALSQDPRAPIFGRIAAASASLWWDGGVTFGLEEAFAATYDDFPIDLFLGAGTMEPALILGYQREMERRLRTRGYAQLHLEAHEYPRTHHSAAWRPTYRHALQFFFPQ